jgi:hypothetical protein
VQLRPLIIPEVFLIGTPFYGIELQYNENLYQDVGFYAKDQVLYVGVTSHFLLYICRLYKLDIA